MAIDPGARTGQPTMDATSLYREEIYTDRKVGTLRVMVPVTASGASAPARATIYTGEAQLMTNMGPLPISFDIEARSLTEAVAGYAEAAKVGGEQTMRELADRAAAALGQIEQMESATPSAERTKRTARAIDLVRGAQRVADGLHLGRAGQGHPVGQVVAGRVVVHRRSD